MEEIQKVVLFSGGRTSGFMLRKLLDTVWDYRERFITIFCNTGKERKETLDFVHEVETRWNVPIVWLEYHRVMAALIPAGIFPTDARNRNLEKASRNGESTHWFNVVDYKTASRNGEPFDELLNHVTALPTVVGRSCSAQLKIRTSFRYLFSIGVKTYSQYIGIRKDEEHRSIQILASADKHEFPKFPLIELGVTEGDVLSFWRSNDFDLNLKSYEGNCDLCFLKAKWKRILLIQENPGMVDWWKNWEERKRNEGFEKHQEFRLGQSYADLEQIASHAKDQDEFCFVKSTEQDIPCSCAERAFEPEDSP